MKSFFIFTVFALTFSFFGTVSASALMGASCTVTADIVDKSYESKYLILKVLDTEERGALGNCSFIKAGDLFKTYESNNVISFDIGDKIEAGAELVSSMSASGDVSSYIQWEPISSIGKISFPFGFILQSDSESAISNGVKVDDKQQVEKQEMEKVDRTNDQRNDVRDQQNDVDDQSNDVEETKKSEVDEKETLPEIIVFTTLAVVLGGAVLYFIFLK